MPSTFSIDREDRIIPYQSYQPYPSLPQNFQLDLKQPLHVVIAQCHDYLYGDGMSQYASVPEIMGEINAIVELVSAAYEKNADIPKEDYSSYRFEQILKAPLFGELLTEVARYYCVSPRRYLLSFLREYEANKYEVKDEHVHHADEVDEESLQRYLDGIIEIAKKTAEERNGKYGKRTDNLIKKILNNQRVCDEDVIKAGFALGMSSEQVADFGLRALSTSLLPLTTHEGLIYRYCLDKKRNFADAQKLLKKYLNLYSEANIEPKKVNDRASAHTYEVLESYEKMISNSKSDEDFQIFMIDEAPFLDVGSKSMLDLYRGLSLFYCLLREEKISIPDNTKPENIESDNTEPDNTEVLKKVFLLFKRMMNPVLENSMHLLSENAKKEKHIQIYLTIEQAFKDTEWDKETCMQMQNIMLGGSKEEQWCYLKRKPTGDMILVDIGDRIYANLMADYSEFRYRNAEACRISKEDFLVLLYKIFRFEQKHEDSIEKSTKFAKAFWATGDRLLRDLCYGIPSGIEFYMPNALETCLTTSLAANISVGEVVDWFGESTNEKKQKKRQFASLWDARDERMSELEKIEEGYIPGINCTTHQFETIKSVANHASEVIKGICNAVDSKQEGWLEEALAKMLAINLIATDAVAEINNLASNKQIEDVASKAKAEIEKMRCTDLKKRFTDSLEKGRKKIITGYSANLSDLERLIDELNKYFSNKKYKCAAFFDENGVFESHPTNQNKKNEGKCIIRWNNELENPLQMNRLFARSGIFESSVSKRNVNREDLAFWIMITANNGYCIADMARYRVECDIASVAKTLVEKATKETGLKPENLEKKQHDTAILFFFMLLYREIQARQHPEKKLKFRVNSDNQRKITLVCSSDFPESLQSSFDKKIKKLLKENANQENARKEN